MGKVKKKFFSNLKNKFLACMSDFRSSSYISPTYYSQLRNAIGYGREDEVNVRQEGLWTVNFKKFQNI